MRSTQLKRLFSAAALCACLGLLQTSCQPAATTAEEQTPLTTNRQEVDLVLDDWHQAAADADFSRYFGHFSSDSAIFIGTDATERWTVAQFKPWSQPYFERGKAWTFTPHNRFVYFSEDGRMAWFDEELKTPNLGPSRGSGVLLHTPQGWKIEHYNLSVPIPNEIVDQVVLKIDSTLNAPEN